MCSIHPGLTWESGWTAQAPLTRASLRKSGQSTGLWPGTMLAEHVLVLTLAGFWNPEGGMLRKGDHRVEELEGNWMVLEPSYPIYRWKTGDLENGSSDALQPSQTTGSEGLTLVFSCWWLLREGTPAGRFFLRDSAYYGVTPPSVFFTSFHFVLCHCSFPSVFLNQGKLSCHCLMSDSYWLSYKILLKSSVTLKNDAWLPFFQVYRRPHFPCDLVLLHHSILLFSLVLKIHLRLLNFTGGRTNFSIALPSPVLAPFG